jgi:hypothetical protein
MQPENLNEMDDGKRARGVKFRSRHYREIMDHEVAIALKDNGSPDEGFRSPPSGPFCCVCGRAVHDGGWFARMRIPGRMLFLCSAPCAIMFFETEEAPAHDHRARHNFQRARDAIIEAAKNAMQTANP